MNLLRQYAVIVGLLLRRELIELGSSWKMKIASQLVYSSMLAFTAAYFMPRMGMVPEAGVPLFLGSFFAGGMMIGFNYALGVGFDLTSTKRTHYYFALPAPHWVILFGITLSLFVRMILLSLPVLACGLPLLGHFHLYAISWPALFAVLFLGATFNATLFLILAFWLSTNMLMTNVWPRFLAFIFTFGCSMYPWRAIAVKSPQLGYLTLLSPMTYCCEGLRSAMLGTDFYLPVAVCIGVLGVLSVVMSMLLCRAVINRLNPVVARGF